MPRRGKRPILAVPDPAHCDDDGTPVVASVQTTPTVSRPFKLSGCVMGEPDRRVTLMLNRTEAEKLARDLVCLLDISPALVGQ